jgi:hypothetical protein
MRRLLINLFLVVLLALYAVSALGILFVDQAFVFFGIVAFLLMFVVGVLTQGFQKRPILLKRIWFVLAPLFVGLFLTTIILSSGRGAPKLEKDSVFATREKYKFTRSEAVSRIRFVTVGVCFTLAWHLLAMGFAAEQWASLRTTIPGPIKPRQHKQKKTSNNVEQL